MDERERGCCGGQIEVPDFAEQLFPQETGDIVIVENPSDFFAPMVNSNNGVTGGCAGLSANCGECCSILTSPAATGNFGVLPSRTGNVRCQCHDICVQRVTHICAIPVREEFDLTPPTGGCRQFLPTCPSGNITGCRVLVTRANERIRNDCLSVDVCAEYALELIPRTGSTICIIRSLSGNCASFFPFPSGAAVSGTALRRVLADTDGSCVVVQLGCIVTGNRVIVSGNLVEKLWRHDNLWVTALTPYTGNTVKKEFTGNILPECVITPR